MSKILIMSQVAISIILIFLILIQNKDGGLGAAFGGGEGFKSTRRGAERVIEWATIVTVFLFLANSFAFVLV
ncbi:preprotein translocase subunit SecG [Candidatus Peregrinibacteria bacterium]|nr:preprotein translocase subunit SecG [Candidatus Peregrinibacteria bacterium]